MGEKRTDAFLFTLESLEWVVSFYLIILQEHQVSHIIKNIKTNGASERDASSVSFWEINKNKLKQLLNIINWRRL